MDSTPVPSHAPGRSGPATVPAGATLVTPVQSKTINDQGNVVQKGPKTPLANRLPALDPAVGPVVPQLAFSKLAMESSDDIAEIAVPLASVSRKREAAEARQKVAESTAASKPPLKRLVCRFQLRAL